MLYRRIEKSEEGKDDALEGAVEHEVVNSSRLTSEPALGDYKIGDPVDPFPGFEIGEYEWPGAAHAADVAAHHIEAGADLWGEIDLVDDPTDSRSNTAIAIPTIAGTGHDSTASH